MGGGHRFARHPASRRMGSRDSWQCLGKGPKFQKPRGQADSMSEAGLGARQDARQTADACPAQRHHPSLAPADGGHLDMWGQGQVTVPAIIRSRAHHVVGLM